MRTSIKRFLVFVVTAAVIMTMLPANLIADTGTMPGTVSDQEVITEDGASVFVAETEGCEPAQETGETVPEETNEEEVLPEEIVQAEYSGDGIQESDPEALQAEAAINEEVVSQEPVYTGSEETYTDTVEAPPIEEAAVITSSDNSNEEIPVELPAENTEAQYMPEQYLYGNDGGIYVKVYAPEGAFEAGTTVKVTAVPEEKVLAAVTEAIEEDVLRVIAADISFFNKNGEPVEPAVKVEVSLSTIDSEEAGDSEQKIVHIDDDNNAEVIEEARTEQIGAQKTAEFDTIDFSVYAIVVTGEDARLKVVFKNSGEDGADVEIYVKKKDTAADDVLATVLYDPGVQGSEGLIFRGWTDTESYSTSTASKTIADVRTEVKGILNSEDGVTDGQTKVYYPMLFRTNTVSYRDERGVVIKTDEVLVPAASTETVSYTIEQDYTPTFPETSNFEGWAELDASGEKTGTVYEVGHTFDSLNTDYDLMADISSGYWISFREVGGSYTPPEFVQEGNESIGTVKYGGTQADPTREGYVFEGWFTGTETETDGEMQVNYGEEYTFGQELEGALTVYAKWIPADTAKYSVMIWKQNVEGTGYDFQEAITFTGTTGSVIDVVSENGSGDGRYAIIDGTGKKYEGFHLDSYEEDVEIVPEGTSAVNVFYNRNVITLNFYIYGKASGYTYNPVNERPGAEGYYYTADGGSTQEYVYYNREDGKWYTDRHLEWVWDGWNSGYRWKYTGSSYETVYTRTGGNGQRQWYLYETMSGLYGSGIAANGYEWPVEYDWYENGHGKGGNMQSGWVGWDYYDPGDVSGLHTTFLDAFLPSDAASTVNFYGTTPSSGSKVIFYIQNVSKTGYDTANTVATGSQGGQFNISDKYSGFHAAQYSVDGGRWHNVGNKNASTGYYGDAVEYSRKLEIRFDREDYDIVYMDGSYVNGDTGAEIQNLSTVKLNASQDVTYGADISSYNKDGADYYTPDEKTGYTFAGWYQDSEGLVPYTFGTMPMHNLTVYAKWAKTQYRVFLHPNADGDESLTYADSAQSTSFRVDYNGQIAEGQSIYMERDEYELVGWYKDENFASVFNFGTFVANDSTVTDEYDQTRPTELDSWGVKTSDDNSDKINNRFWINNSLDLYAKWRSKLPGANGISVVYDAGEGTGAPVDERYYADLAESTAGAASQYTDDSKVFSHWVIQKWDEDAGAYADTEQTVYPGETFVVRKDYSKRVITEGTAENIIAATYTVQLRAEYIEPEALTPTHISWFKNDGTAAFHTDGEEEGTLKINEAVDIQQAPVRKGYNFLGWARVEETDGMSLEQDLTADDLFLTWHEDSGSYTAVVDGTAMTVEMVAADEIAPLHALFAVWERKTADYKVEYYYMIDEGAYSSTCDSSSTRSEYVGETVSVSDEDKVPKNDAYVLDEDENDAWSGAVLDQTDTGYPLTLKVYFAKLFTVTYEYTGEVPEGAPSVPDTAKYKPGAQVNAAVVPTLTGYTFSGWTGEVTEMPARDVAVTGSWTINSHTVTYEYTGTVPEGAPEVPGQQTYTYGADVPAAEVPTMTGYTFSGWTGEVTTMPDEDVTITGSWTVNSHKVTYKYAGEIPEDAPSVPAEKTYNYNDTVPAAAVPTLTGYTFSGWTGEVTTMPDEDVTVIGSWTVNSYNVSYSYTGNVPENAPDVPEESAHEYKSKVSVAEAPTLPGYIFSGWSREGDFDMPAEDVVITGEWSPADDTKYTVKHWLQNIADDDYSQDTSIAADQTKTGTTDSLTQAEAYTITGFTAQDITQATINGDGTTVVNVYYDRNVHKVTYSYTGDVPKNAPSVPDEAEYKYGAEVPSASVPETAGYTFSGWTGEVAAMPDEDVTVTGSWMVNQYEVTFVDDDGTVLKEAAKYDYGTAAADIVKPDDPAKEATAQYTYTFAGWTPEIADVTADAVYTAQYTETVNKYTVTFVDYDDTVLKEAAEYEYGTKAADVVKPADPERDADDYTYVFAGWGPEIADVTANAVYKAKYDSSEVFVTITYKASEGGSVSVQNEKLAVVTGDSKGSTAAPDNGYEFVNWTDKEGNVVGTEAAFIPGKVEGKNVAAEYTANFKASVYNITYDLNGGEYNGSTENIVEGHTFGETITIHEAPERKGYVFSYWKGSEYKPGDSYTVEGDHVFTAVWEEEKAPKENDTPKRPDAPNAVNTGDGNETGGVLAVLIASIVCLAALVYIYMRRRSA